MGKNSRIWLYNYDFEFELARTLPYQNNGTSPLWFFLNRSSSLFLPLTASDDRILAYEKPHPGLLSRLERKLGFLPEYRILKLEGPESNSILNDLLRSPSKTEALDSCRLEPWGWSPQAEKAVTLGGGTYRDGKSKAETVRHLNSKRTSFILRNRLLPPSFRFPSKNVGLGSVRSKSLRQRIDAFAEKNRPFYVKHYFGVSGQLSILHDSGGIPDRALETYKSWIEKSGGIILEKRVEGRKELGFQFHFAGGRATFLGATEGLYSRFGSYRGSVVCRDGEHRYRKSVELLKPVCDYVLSSGYRGPLGIDTIETAKGERKLLEINARYTMGRLAIAWHHRVNPQKWGLLFTRFFAAKSFFGTESLLTVLDSIEKSFQAEITPIHHCCRPYGKGFRCFCIVFIGCATRNRLIECRNGIDALFHGLS